MFLSTQLFSKSPEGKRLYFKVKDIVKKKKILIKLNYCIVLIKKSNL